ncbi:hypothetical protein SAMN04487963_3419 [Marinobacter zhejiangensis]|uniref:Uncharacterized protein n=2 Tax=Marinobacter zhejiangensis TaxID=488535 RepID=A0A1I4T0I0_9GAMM|nr:hypothetical protein SAMN04487963_3419 [Marinobacter zhejiangensis]
MNPYWNNAAVWLLIAVLAVLNGFLREAILQPLLGARLALPVSGVALALIVLIVTFVCFRWLAGPYWLIGIQWVVMTLLFEFGFGHYVAGKSWPELLQTFNVLRGDLFVLVLLVSLIAPRLVAWLYTR